MGCVYSPQSEKGFSSGRDAATYPAEQGGALHKQNSCSFWYWPYTMASICTLLLYLFYAKDTQLRAAGSWS